MVASARWAGALVLACHPMPTLAVTTFATGYAAAAGAAPARLPLVAAAVLSGQLTVGWSNDAIDAGRDAAVRRADKPVAAGRVPRRVVGVAAVVAAVACVALSLALGAAPGLLHLVAVAAAVAYNAGLKRTAASPLPYAVAFGLLPVVGSLVAGGAAPASHVLAAALLGLAAHFGNTVPDAAADAATGVRGLPQRLGPRRSALVVTALVAAAAVVLLAGLLAAPGPRLAPVALLLAGAALAAAAPAVPPRHAWRLTLAAVSLVVAGFLLAATTTLGRLTLP